MNNVIYWFSQIVGASIFGYAIDLTRMSRTQRAKVAIAILMFLTLGIWGAGYAWQEGFADRAWGQSSADFPIRDWNSAGYYMDLLLYIAYGIYGAIWQSFIYW